MKKITKTQISVSILTCILLSLFPFLTRTKDETLNTTLATSFTILSTLISITTLIVAIILFDRFGINAKFKERQVDTILELVNELKAIHLSPSSEKIAYANYIRKCKNFERFPKSVYEVDKTKILLFPANFEKLISPVFRFYYNPWLPMEIKNKLDFLNIMGSYQADNISNSEYVKLDVNNSGISPWEATIPKFTFEMFSINLSILLSTVTKWLSDHSTINIDFDIIKKH